MIEFERKVLDNGLTIVVHEDSSTPLIAIDVLYKVGSKYENPDKTGFAHLFEHLMFSGSENAPDFDMPIQQAGGESNAFTNSDCTNFYEIVPVENFETTLWLESDRMKNLVCDQKAFDVQQKVVIEEFKETTLNQPYGDVWHTISAASYEDHPYQWPTIGKIPEHVANAKLEEVRAFYEKYYRPNNAIISIAGNISHQQAFELVEKWFGDIPAGVRVEKNWSAEKEQKAFRQISKKAKVPLRSLYLSFHMDERKSIDFYVCDIISDILSGGRSSRFYQRLIKEKEAFSQLEAYVTGTEEPGLFLIEAKPNTDIDMKSALEYVWTELDELKKGKLGEVELEKVKNKIESALIFSEVNALNKAINIAFFEMIGDVSLINKQSEYYQNITIEDVVRVANKIFIKSNCTEVSYYPNE